MSEDAWRHVGGLIAQFKCTSDPVVVQMIRGNAPTTSGRPRQETNCEWPIGPQFVGPSGRQGIAICFSYIWAEEELEPWAMYQFAESNRLVLMLEMISPF